MKAAKKAQLQIVADWIASEQQRHLAQSRLVAFSVMNHLRKGLPERICRNGVVGEPGLDPELGTFAIADPSGNITCNSIPWLQLNSLAWRGQRCERDILQGCPNRLVRNA